MLEIVLAYLIAAVTIVLLTYMAKRNRQQGWRPKPWVSAFDSRFYTTLENAPDTRLETAQREDTNVMEAPLLPEPAGDKLLHIAELTCLLSALSAEEVRHAWAQMQHPRV